MSTRVVAIDGPSGVGKSTVARQLARRLDVPMLDTGAMYRTVALATLRAGADPAAASDVESIVAGLDIDLRADGDSGFGVWLDGAPVGDAIRTPEVSEAASRVSTHAVVRQQMVELQRRCAERAGGVLEGRDIGSVVFPSTPYKFFLTASPAVRAERRYQQLTATGKAVDRAQVEREVIERDARDTGRQLSPLRSDNSYLVVDSTERSPQQVVDLMAEHIESTDRGSATE